MERCSNTEHDKNKNKIQTRKTYGDEENFVFMYILEFNKNEAKSRAKNNNKRIHYYQGYKHIIHHNGASTFTQNDAIISQKREHNRQYVVWHGFEQ